MREDTCTGVVGLAVEEQRMGLALRNVGRHQTEDGFVAVERALAGAEERDLGQNSAGGYDSSP